ncbi:hypothetical protein [Nonomuraea sp. NPDC049309]|uniref:hypothetical protein n=1 Tax=Nonomuraea sp. NPDC049309 TaxID=3364350 RepID=UPI00371D9425
MIITVAVVVIAGLVVALIVVLRRQRTSSARVRAPAVSPSQAATVAETAVSPDARAPQQVGPYRVVRKLGGGGMGEVYLGRSPGGRDVALKVVRPELADDPDFRRRFATEITAARRVGGFHTAQVVDADPDGDPPWLATAYVPGSTLHEAVRERGPLPLPEVAALGAPPPSSAPPRTCPRNR